MRTYGWYEYDDAPWRMRNSQTDQEILVQNFSQKTEKAEFLEGWSSDDKAIFLSKHQGSRAFVSSYEIKMVYKDKDIKKLIPITLLSCNDEIRGVGTPNERRIPSQLNIIINYNLFIKMPSFFTKGNSYGEWRRIDDFLTDALLCWPDTVFDGRPNKLILIGGWFQGKWSSNFQRTIISPPIQPQHLASYPVIEASITPLDMPAPKEWRYIDKELPKTEANLIFSTVNELKLPYLSRDSKIEGFQDKVPYLVREDEEAYIFVAKLEPDTLRGEDPITNFWYTYVDNDLFFTFRSHAAYGLELRSCKDYGFRELPPKRELWASDIFGRVGESSYVGLYGSSHLSYKVWRNIVHIIVDAWPAWKDNGNGMRRIEIDNSVELPPFYGRTGYAGQYGPQINGGFAGGLSNSSYTIKIDTF